MKFFRLFRKQEVIANRFRHYLVYAIGEIILIVVGILIALQINNWNEFRKQRQVERQILTEIRESLISDLNNEIRPEIEQTKADLENMIYISDLLKDRKPYDPQITTRFKSLMYSKDFVWGVTANKTLENVGISILSDPNLKKRIVELYNTRYPEVKNNVGNFSNNLIQFFRPVMRERFKFNHKETASEYQPLDYEELLDDVIFFNSVETARLNFRNILGSLESLEAEVTDIIALIEQQLGTN